MTLLKPAAQKDLDRSIRGDSTCRVQHVIPTGVIFAATLERLNRKSAMVLFQELAQELDSHGRRLDEGGSAGRDAGPLRTELAALLALLREKTEQHRDEAVYLEQQLSGLREQTARAQAEFEKQLAALVSAQVEQQLARAFAEASTRQEQSLSAAIERDLKPVSTQLTQALASHAQRARGPGLLYLLLALLLASGCFMLGWLTARRPAPATQVPAATSAARIADSNRSTAAVALSPKLESPRGATASAQTE